MTKYVLQSGGLNNNLPGRKAFHEEIVRGLGERLHFVLCNFAQSREVWEQKLPGYSNYFAEDLPGHEITCELAMPDEFEEQIRRADVLYMHGGDNDLIETRMRRYKLPDIWEDKVVATNSASSQLLSAAYYTSDWRACRPGFGILPIKFIPHFGAQMGIQDDPRGPIVWSKAYDELAAYGDTSLPIHALKEGEFVVIEA